MLGLICCSSVLLLSLELLQAPFQALNLLSSTRKRPLLLLCALKVARENLSLELPHLALQLAHLDLLLALPLTLLGVLLLHLAVSLGEPSLLPLLLALHLAQLLLEVLVLPSAAPPSPPRPSSSTSTSSSLSSCEPMMGSDSSRPIGRGEVACAHAGEECSSQHSEEAEICSDGLPPRRLAPVRRYPAPLLPRSTHPTPVRALCGCMPL